MALDLIKIFRLSVEMGMDVKLTAASELPVILPQLAGVRFPTHSELMWLPHNEVCDSGRLLTKTIFGQHKIHSTLKLFPSLSKSWNKLRFSEQELEQNWLLPLGPFTEDRT